MTRLTDDPIALLHEYRRLYEEHWAVTQSARSLSDARDQAETYDRARALRGETARILPFVEQHLRAVGIDVTEVSGGVRPAAVARVIDLAIERHRQRQSRVVPIDLSEEPNAPLRRRGLVLAASLVALASGGLGWALVAGWL